MDERTVVQIGQCLKVKQDARPQKSRKERKVERKKMKKQKNGNENMKQKKTDGIIVS